MTSLVVVRCVTGRRVWSRWRDCQWLTGRYETASDRQVDVCGQDDEAASDWQVDWYGKYADETASDWQVDCACDWQPGVSLVMCCIQWLKLCHSCTLRQLSWLAGALVFSYVYVMIELPSVDIHWNVTEIVPGEPPIGGFKRKRGSQL